MKTLGGLLLIFLAIVGLMLLTAWSQAWSDSKKADQAMLARRETFEGAKVMSRAEIVGAIVDKFPLCARGLGLEEHETAKLTQKRGFSLTLEIQSSPGCHIELGGVATEEVAQNLAVVLWLANENRKLIEHIDVFWTATASFGKSVSYYVTFFPSKIPSWCIRESSIDSDWGEQSDEWEFVSRKLRIALNQKEECISVDTDTASGYQFVPR